MVLDYIEKTEETKEDQKRLEEFQKNCVIVVEFLKNKPYVPLSLLIESISVPYESLRKVLQYGEQLGFLTFDRESKYITFIPPPSCSFDDEITDESVAIE
jgi:hypothetical protein